MISVVCVYNDRRTLSDLLCASLQWQDAEHQLILIDNTRGQYASAAHALNQGANQARGEYLMFVHQDVVLPATTWLTEAENLLSAAASDLGMAGVAGARTGSRPGRVEVIGNVQHGVPPRNATMLSVHKPEKVQTLDECLTIVPARVFSQLQFDAESLHGWHLYAVDYCLKLARRGLQTYVLPLSVYHRSDGIQNRGPLKQVWGLGPFPAEYYANLERVLCVQRTTQKYVYATTGCWHTSAPLLIQRVITVMKGARHMMLVFILDELVRLKTPALDRVLRAFRVLSGHARGPRGMEDVR